MSEKHSSLKDEEFIFAYVHEYLADDLPGDVTQRYKALMADPANAAIPEGLNAAFGKFQLSYQSYYLTEDQRVRLHEIVEDSEIRKTREIEKIAEVGRWEAFGDFRRRLGLVLLVGIVVLGVIYYFTPDETPAFDALNSLGYEAQAMEEDPEGRLDLPTNDIVEISEFFAGNKSLEFKPIILKHMPRDWVADGATVIEYDGAKVTAVQYSNANLSEKLFHFVYKGRISDLIATEPGDYQGFEYRAYQSEFLNIIAWQQDADAVALLVGHRGAAELASLARRGL